MLKTKRNYPFDKLDSTGSADYVISPDDKITLRLFANDGFKLIDLTSQQSQQSQIQRSGQNNMQFYRVQADSTADLPAIGDVKVAGKTIRQAEDFLEKEYEKFYVKPWAQVQVINRRVMIFPGAYGQARVLTLINENTTLMEGLAQSGGLAQNGKAKRIKLIRGPISNPQVYLFDLSTIEGYKQANITLQANDIIYVEPIRNNVTQAIREIAPVLSIVTSALSLYVILSRL